MARRAFPVRKSLRDVKLANNAADRYYAAMAGKEPMAQSQIAPKRIIKNRTPDEDLESGVLREVVKVIAGHRNVLFALRTNSGMIPNAGGAPVWFYRWIKNDECMTLTDIWGMFRDARFITSAPEVFAIECKHRAWHYTGTDREVQQKAFIDRIIASGGRGGFVTSAESALAILK